MPGRHPDDDLLADLAADVLPADQARAVEAHVMSCNRCAGLLEDAEHVRSLLLAGDPGPVPADVWRRIEAALAAEGAGATSSTARPDHARDTAAFQAFVDSRPLEHAGPHDHAAPLDHPDPRDHAGPLAEADAVEDADPLDDPSRWGRRPVRAGSGTGGSRRDARARSARPLGPWLLAAAAVLAVVAVTGSVKLLARQSASGASGSAGIAESAPSASAGAGASPSRALVVRSGRDYRASTLAADASALLAATTGASTAVTGGHATGGSAAAGSASRRAASSEAVPPRASKAPAAPAPSDTSATDITNPARLAACLGALGATPDRLVAVDLARYEGREAAILLLTSAEGSGHEVWAVERTCAPGAEGALKYTRLSN